MESSICSISVLSEAKEELGQLMVISKAEHTLYVLNTFFHFNTFKLFFSLGSQTPYVILLYPFGVHVCLLSFQ